MDCRFCSHLKECVWNTSEYGKIEYNFCNISGVSNPCNCAFGEEELQTAAICWNCTLYNTDKCKYEDIVDGFHEACIQFNRK